MARHSGAMSGAASPEATALVICGAARQAVKAAPAGASIATWTSLASRVTAYLWSASRSITTRTVFSRYCATRMLVTPPRGT